MSDSRRSHETPATNARIASLVRAVTLPAVALCLILAATKDDSRGTWLLLALMLLGIGWAASSSRRRWQSREMADRLESIAEGDFTQRLERPADHSLARIGRAAEMALRSSSQALARSESECEELRTVFGSVGHGLVALDDKQRIKSANGAAERLLALVPGAYRGRLLQEACRQPELNRFVDEALGSASGHSAELQLGGPAGAAVQAVAEPLRRSDGTVDGILIALGDITRTRRLESMRSDFAANVSHELRTPITSIKGYAETLQQIGFADVEQAQKFLGVIVHSSQRLGALVDDLLALASLEQPGAAARLEFRSLRVGVLIEAITEQLSLAAAARSIKVEARGDQELTLWGNQLLVEQALLNLLSNAIKHSHETGVIAITASEAVESGVTVTEIRIDDRGTGIAAKHLPRVFDRFSRVDASRSSAQGGTGIGLALVKHIAAVHGGAVSAQSELGVGSSFALRIPRRSGEVLQQSRSDLNTS
ncbi:MAG: hypothetical protein EXS00_00985 [Phycisphaerales bacterium]|nr:hypothetical protein [Phycisphaerales bacterium]